MGASFATEWLKFFTELSGANVFTLVMMFSFLIGFAAWKLHHGYRTFAKRCGAQKSLLVGYVQDSDKCSPQAAIIKVNEMTRKLLEQVNVD